MSSRTKQRRSGGLTLLLYQRTLHPELFKIFATEQVSRRIETTPALKGREQLTGVLRRLGFKLL